MRPQWQDSLDRDTRPCEVADTATLSPGLVSRPLHRPTRE